MHENQRCCETALVKYCTQTLFDTFDTILLLTLYTFM